MERIPHFQNFLKNIAQKLHFSIGKACKRFAWAGSMLIRPLPYKSFSKK